jgi:hypothetical protein
MAGDAVDGSESVDWNKVFSVYAVDAVQALDVVSTLSVLIRSVTDAVVMLDSASIPSPTTTGAPVGGGGFERRQPIPRPPQHKPRQTERQRVKAIQDHRRKLLVLAALLDEEF